ncbi:MAG: hypothetical protein E6058_10025, partial [Cutibacterium avidum]|nr:hypothetical protein [Propionibacterium sp.]MDU5547629.1 hypothetical protein [Cutibacterium avidum]MDU5969047.1 hypothetical protein [Cutibacterium avidum]
TTPPGSFMRQGQQVMPGPATVTPPYGVTSKVTEDDGEVLQFESFAQSDVDSMRKAPIMADVPLSKGSNCEVTNEVTVLFLGDGRVFQHRVVECTYADEK